jgi:cellulose synthase/poly-beta-1,6-N-acetylglucosamine synthase-like glycosyltransferase
VGTVTVGITFVVLALICTFTSIQGFVLMLVARNGDRVPPERLAGPRRRVSVLVPCFNEERVLRKTVDSIMESRGVDIDRIICIDDGSTDSTIEVMRDTARRYGDTITVLSQENRGKAAALNHGLTASDTEFFVCVDADTQVLPDTVARLLGRFDDPRVAAVSGQMIVGNGFPAQEFVCDAQVREYEFANNIERRAFSRMQRITVIPGPIGAFRRRAVAEAGGYPETTLVEDAHLTFLLLIGGHRTVHEPSAVALTEAPDTVAGLRRQRIRWATGKMQLNLRIARLALKQRGVTTLIWLYLSWNDSVLPLLAVPKAILFPLCAVAIILSGGTSAVTGVVVISLLTIAVNYAHFVVVRRFARVLDAEGRAAVGLAEAPTGLLSTVVISVVGSIAIWVALYRIVTGRRGVWDKLDRSGDVQVQADRRFTPQAMDEAIDGG